MYVSIRDCMLSASGVDDPFEALKSLGLSSVELVVSKEAEVGSMVEDGAAPLVLTQPADRSQLMEKLDVIEGSVCAFLMANDFSSEDFDYEVQALTKVARAADEMGVPVVRVDLVPRQGDMDEETFTKRCVRGLGDALDKTETVEFGIENHGETSNRPEFLDRVLDGVGDDRLGLTLDTGNFYWYGHPLEMVYHLMEKYAGRVKHTHVKNICYPEDIRQKQREMGYRYGDYVCPVFEGDVDHKLVVQILAEVGYDRSLCIEDESLGKFSATEKAEVLEKDVEFLKSLCGAR